MTTATPSKANVNVGLFVLLFLSIVVVRFFIETVPVLPRAFEYAYDLLLPVAFLVMLLPRVPRPSFRFYGLGVWLAVFISVWLFSSLLNRDVHPLSAVAFLVMHLEGPLWFLILANLAWTRTDLATCSKVIFVLGMIQIIVGSIQIPYGLHSTNPDVVSGTYGQNSSQMVFFLAIFTFLLLAYYSVGKARLLPMLFMAAWVVIVFDAAGFRSLWLFYPLTAILVAYLGGRISKRKLLTVAGGLLISMSLAVLVVGQAVSIFADVLGVQITQLGKVEAFLNVSRLYQQRVHIAIIGCGPGTFSSRAWATFTRIGTYGAVDYSVFENVNWGSGPSEGLAKYTPGYYSAKYTLPIYQKPVALLGSITIDGPFTSYAALLSEVGCLGTFALVGAYVSTLMTLRRIMKASSDRFCFVLALTAIGGFLLLLQMSIFDNWLEVGRVTIPVWAIAALPIAHARARLDRSRQELPQATSPLGEGVGS